MNLKHVAGENRGEVVLYALSTCGWCRKTKDLLNSLGVEYSYIDVDSLDSEEKVSVKEEIRRWNPACSFPTIVVNNETCIKGYAAERIKEVLGG
ncbi:MAG: glutaredoxin family protein [Gemmatimonadota bacterium]|nr:MAG: glutaredoxin family protein [Gemmatimonadota bacterium]